MLHGFNEAHWDMLSFQRNLVVRLADAQTPNRVPAEAQPESHATACEV